MECLVQGIIETQHVEALRTLLEGLCGGQPEPISVHELCFKSAPNLGAAHSELRLACSLHGPEPKWSVRHVGGSMRGAEAEKLAATVRSVLQASVTSSALPFLQALGYRLDYELVRSGFGFVSYQRSGAIKITVTSILKVPVRHAVEQAVPLVAGLELVEVSAPATAESYTEVSAAIAAFSDHLAALVKLSKPGVVTGLEPGAATAAGAILPSRPIASA